MKHSSGRLPSITPRMKAVSRHLRHIGRLSLMHSYSSVILSSAKFNQSINSPCSANMWFIGPRPRPRSSMAASAPDM